MIINGEKIYSEIKARTYANCDPGKHEIIKKYCDFIHEYKDKLERYYDFKMRDACYMDINEIPLLKQNGIVYNYQVQSDMFYTWCDWYYEDYKADMSYNGLEDTFYQVGRTSSHYINREVADAYYNGELDYDWLFNEITEYYIADIMSEDDSYYLNDAYYLLDKWTENTKGLIDLYVNYEENQAENFTDFIIAEVYEQLYSGMPVMIDAGHGKQAYTLA